MPYQGNHDITDAELWQDLNAGNEDAFNTLYQRYFEGLYIYGNQLYKDEDVVKDCIQNLFVEIWQKRGKLSEVKYVKAYLFKSIRRKIGKTLAGRQKFVSEEAAIDLEVIFSHEHLIISEQLSEEKVNKLHNAFSQLTSRQKEAVMLRFYDNLSYSEIAAVMDLKETKYARNLIYKAIDELKKRITPSFITSLFLILTTLLAF